MSHVVLQLPPDKHTRHTAGRTRGSCERCQESKGAIKLGIVSPAGPSLPSWITCLTTPEPPLSPRAVGEQPCAARDEGFPAGLSRGASRRLPNCFVLEPIQREPEQRAAVCHPLHARSSKEKKKKKRIIALGGKPHNLHSSDTSSAWPDPAVLQLISLYVAI